MIAFVAQAKNTNIAMASSSGSQSRCIAIAISIFLAFASALHADVTLSSKFGNLVVSGELVEYESGFYTIRTEGGILTLREADVTCRGIDCPVFDEFSQKISVYPGHHVDKIALLKLFKAYTKRDGLRFIQQGNSANPDLIEISDPSGSKIVEISFDKAPTSFVITSDEPDVEFANAAVQIVSSSPIIANGVSLARVQDIWTGSTSNWSELGGVDQKIRVLAPAFSEEIQNALTASGATESSSVGLHVELFLSADQILAEIDNDSNAVGFIVSATSSEYTVSIEHCGKLANFDEGPDAYPLTVPIGFKSSADRLPLTADQMIDFLRSEDASDVLKSIDLVLYQAPPDIACSETSQ